MSLRKEMAIAIILGLLFGAGVAFGLRQLPGTVEKNGPVPTAQPDIAASPTLLLDKALSLEVLLPEHQSLLYEKEVAVSGKTNPLATVAVTSPLGEAVVTAGEDGTFSATVPLADGANELFVASMQNGNTATKSIIVNYLPDSL